MRQQIVLLAKQKPYVSNFKKLLNTGMDRFVVFENNLKV